MSDEAEQAAIDRAEEQYAEAQAALAEAQVQAMTLPGAAMTVPEAITAVEEAAERQKLSRPITPAQAKIEAVASLTAAAYAKASQLQLSPEEVKALQAEFPDEAFKPGAGGKQHLLYIEHAFLRDRLNQVLGPGQWALIPRNRWEEKFEQWSNGKRIEASRIYVEAMLMVRGSFVAEAVGDMVYYPKNQSTNYGDAVEGAKTAALRRCCKEFGIGLQAWKQDWSVGWWERHPDGKASQSPQEAPGRAAGPKPWDRGQKPPVGSPKPTVARPSATEAHKARLLEVLTENGDLATWSREFFEKVGAILPNESLEDVPLSHVPVTAEQKDALMRAIGEFGSGEEARLPYPLNLVTFRKEAEKAQPKNASTDPSDPNSPQAPWRSFPMPFGKSAGVKLADLDKKYLYGLWANFTVEKTYNGKPRPAEKIASDQRLRNYLNDAGVHYAFTKKD